MITSHRRNSYRNECIVLSFLFSQCFSYIFFFITFCYFFFFSFFSLLHSFSVYAFHSFSVIFYIHFLGEHINLRYIHILSVMSSLLCIVLFTSLFFSDELFLLPFFVVCFSLFPSSFSLSNFRHFIIYYVLFSLQT